MKELSFDFDNFGGTLHLYAVPLASFRRLVKDYVTGSVTAQFRNRQDIISIEMFADDTFQFSETKDVAEGGVFYDVAISGVIPKWAEANDELVETLERGEWLVVTKDNNGTVRLAGNETDLLRFNTVKDTGTTRPERNGIAFTFTGKQPNAAVAVDATDMLT